MSLHDSQDMHICYQYPQQLRTKSIQYSLVSYPPATFSFVVLFIHLDFPCLSFELDSKSRKSRNTWSNRQIWPWSTEWSRAKGNRVLPRERTGHSKHPLPTTQEKILHMDITRWSTLQSDWWYSLQSKVEKLYIVSKKRTGNQLWLRSWAAYAKFRLTLKKVGITTGPFRYDLNQIPYNYIVEVRNRFKGLDLIDRVPDELWTEVRDIVQETGIKTIPKKKKWKKAKWLSEEALQIAVKRREVKSKGEKERYTHVNAEFQRIARRDKKAFLSDQCKEIGENNRMGKTRDLFKKKRYQGNTSCKDVLNNGQKWYGPNKSRRY